MTPLGKWRGFPGGAVVKNPPVNVGDAGSWVPIWGGGNGNPLQYYCQQNPMDRGAWQAQSMGHTKSDTTENTHTHSGKWKDKTLEDFCHMFCITDKGPITRMCIQTSKKKLDNPTEKWGISSSQNSLSDHS